MAKVIDQSGSLKHLFTELNNKSITRFKSLNAIQQFRKFWKNEIAEYREMVKIKLDEEIKHLKKEHQILSEQYDKKREIRTKVLVEEKEGIEPKLNLYSTKQKFVFKRITYFLKLRKLLRRQRTLEENFESELNRPFKKLLRNIRKTQSKIDYRNANFEAIVDQRSRNHSREIIRIKNIIQNLEPLIAGSVGEQKAITELAKLSEDYTIINDYYQIFSKPLYNRKINDKINSIQVDHIIVGPSGIFLVETKFWSKKSVENLDLYSPVKQIKRSNYAIFLILNRAIENRNIRLRSHH